MSYANHGEAGLIDHIAETLEEHEDGLTKRVLGFAKRHGYAQDASTLEASWRLSVRLLTTALLGGLRARGRCQAPENGAARPRSSATDFAVAIAASHRARGVSLPMFMGLLKLYRRAYVDLFLQAEPVGEDEVEAALLLRDAFDEIEVCVCEEWNSADRSARFQELQFANRFLANEKNKYLTIFESLNQPVFILRPDGRLDNANKAAMDFMGWPEIPRGSVYYCAMRDRPREFEARLETDEEPRSAGLAEIGLNWLQEEADRFRQDGALVEQLEKSLGDGEGKRVFMVTLCRMADVREHFGGVVLLLNDITDARRKEEALTKALRERDVLFKEVHHRVKNNMQIVSSLISLQAQQTASEEAAAAFLKSQLRIRAMATAHEKLYRSESVDRIGLGGYLRDVLGIVQQAFRREGSAIDVVAEVEDAAVSMDAAVPCGLIVSELVTNCFKHAFRRKENGTVRLLLRSEESGLLLVVDDDGDGMEVKEAGGLGMELVRALVEQLYGRLTIRSEAGTRFEIAFPAE